MNNWLELNHYGKKSRELWVVEGDKNIKFFHTSTLNCRKKIIILLWNYIMGIGLGTIIR